MNKDRRSRALAYFERAGIQTFITALEGDARKLLPTLDLTFDFVFIDAAKGEYLEYLNLIYPLIAPGGVLVVDNVLFRGWTNNELEQHQREVKRELKSDKEPLNKGVSSQRQRYEEIDVLRVVALVLMVIFHLVYDLKEFAGVNIDYQSSFWFTEGKTSALLFIFISGLSNGFSSSPVRRGLKVLFYGMGITVVTYLFMKDEYVRFGILHFLGVAMILSPLLVRLSSGTLWGLAGSSAVLGFWFKGQLLKTSLLLPLGLMYEGFGTMDYYPLFPYLAVTILGILAYRTFYAQRPEPPFSFQLNSKLVRWLSRNSLGIYLVHQPLLLLMIFVIKRL